MGSACVRQIFTQTSPALQRAHKKKDLTAIKLSGGCCCFFLKFYDSFSPRLFLIANASVTTFLMSFPKRALGTSTYPCGLGSERTQGRQREFSSLFHPHPLPKLLSEGRLSRGKGRQQYLSTRRAGVHPLQSQPIMTKRRGCCQR